MDRNRVILLILAFLAVSIIIAALCGLIFLKSEENKAMRRRSRTKKAAAHNNRKSGEKTNVIASFGDRFVTDDLQKIFDNSKNPWGITKATFQGIRFGGLIILVVIGLVFLPIKTPVAIFSIALGVLCFWYPMYYYKAIGQEREAEWCKMYEFVWVLKHNAMLYDPAKTYMNTRNYIAEHAPHDEELIRGFDDFYRLWDPDQIDPRIIREYNFSIPREITQIMFNMNKTGEFPEDQLNALRVFIVNTQNLTVEQTLSKVSGSATVFSLPFMMISVIVSFLVPMLMQILDLL